MKPRMKVLRVLASLSIAVLFCAFSLNLSAQKLFFTQNGKISFFSTTPVEDIQAENAKVNSVLNAETGALSFKLPVSKFEFPNKLMQEHFNENYLETEKYPTSEFKGRIMDFKSLDLSKPGVYNVSVTGELTIHGVTRTVTERGTLEVLPDGQIRAKAKFPVALKDYKIKIPSIVVSNIAEVVEVSCDLLYAPYQK